ncbi:MAG: N-acetylhexosamine 1-kinase [Saprospiraceae bacterium]|nr:N-acetylhexosamine 1-kinase [Saprospiraceae bacterium]
MQTELLARCFFRFDRWIGAAAFGSGNINDTWRIEFEKNGVIEVWLLQRLNHRVFRDPAAVMRNIQLVCEHLAEGDYPFTVVAPVAALDGRFLQNDKEGNYWRVFPFLENTFTPGNLTNAEIAYEGARAYGAFARALRNFPAASLEETIPGFHDTDRRWETFLKVLEENPSGRADTSKAEIAAMFAAKPLFDRISHLKQSGALPQRVTHNDTKAGNVLFDSNTRKALAVIDLDTVMPGTILSDFGDMVRTFAPDRPEDDPGSVTLRSDILEALQRGFLEQTGDFLTSSEKENLLPGAAWITGEQALRFLTDWLAGDTYYKIRYPEHNLVRTRNQLALFREILGIVEG